jgi:hypothetical protein
MKNKGNLILTVVFSLVLMFTFMFEASADSKKSNRLHIDLNLPASFSITYNAGLENGKKTGLIKYVKTSQGDYLSSTLQNVSELRIKNGNSCDIYRGRSLKFVETRAFVESHMELTKRETVQMEINKTFANKEFAFTKDIVAHSVLGRTCEKYTFDNNYGGTRVILEYWIDTATGVCLKYIQNYYQKEKIVHNLQMEAIEFLTGGDIRLPDPTKKS